MKPRIIAVVALLALAGCSSPTVKAAPAPSAVSLLGSAPVSKPAATRSPAARRIVEPHRSPTHTARPPARPTTAHTPTRAPVRVPTVKPKPHVTVTTAPAIFYRTAGAWCKTTDLGVYGRTKLGVQVRCEHKTAGDKPRWYREL